MSCTVKHDVGRVLESMCSASLPGSSGSPESSPAPMPAAFLISLPVGLEGAPVAQYLSDLFDLDDWGMSLYVGDVANAVGLDEFEERFFDDDRLCLYGLGGLGEEDAVYDERSTGAVVSRLIREASCVLELPVVGAGCLSRHLDAAGECRCRGIVRAVAEPDAVVYEDARAVGIHDLPHCSAGMKLSAR